jgi:GntR family transcriptional regulator
MDADPVVIRPTSIPGQVATFLRQAMDRGDYQPGALLPAERLLAERFQVSIATIRQALAMLVAEGLVIKVNGKGTIVRGRPGPPETITRTAADPWTDLVPKGDPEPRRDTARARMAALFGIPEGSVLFIVDQTGTHAPTGRAVLTRRTLPNHSFDGMDAYPDPFGTRSEIITALEKHYGSLHQTEQVRPLMPDSDERSMLNLGPGDLIQEATRLTRTRDGRALLAETQRYGEGVVLEYALPH